MTHLRHLALAAVPLVLMAACGGDDDAAKPATDPQPYIDAATASLTADEEFPFDKEAATCISTALVDVIGADTLARAKVTPEEFGEADTFEVLAVDVPDDAPARLRKGLDGCDTAGAFSAGFVAALGVDVPPEDVACLTDGLDPDVLNDALAKTFVGATGEAGKSLDDTVGAELLDAVVGCSGLVTATFLAEAPGPVTAEAKACVSKIVEANPDRVRAAFGGEADAADALGTEIGTSCAGALG
jgi:hypothetical protein